MNTQNYDPKKDEVVVRFVEELKKTISYNLKNIILYGSRARGDNQKDSDYDFLVILSSKNYELNEFVYDAGYLILDSYEKHASCTIWDEKEFSRKKDFSLGKNILRDGITLYEYRETGGYDIDANIDENLAKESILIATEILTEIKKYIVENSKST